MPRCERMLPSAGSTNVSERARPGVAAVTTLGEMSRIAALALIVRRLGEWNAAARAVPGAPEEPTLSAAIDRPSGDQKNPMIEPGSSVRTAPECASRIFSGPTGRSVAGEAAL